MRFFIFLKARDERNSPFGVHQGCRSPKVGAVQLVPPIASTAVVGVHVIPCFPKVSQKRT
jgi:hypothetical protein